MKAAFALIVVLGVVHVQNGAAVGLRAGSLHAAVMAAHAEESSVDVAFAILQQMAAANEALKKELSDAREAEMILLVQEKEEQLQKMQESAKDALTLGIISGAIQMASGAMSIAAGSSNKALSSAAQATTLAQAKQEMQNSGDQEVQAAVKEYDSQVAQASLKNELTESSLSAAKEASLSIQQSLLSAVKDAQEYMNQVFKRT